MKNSKHYLQLLICLLFIFSCNTEAKFGFRKKNKVDNHPTAYVNRKKVDTQKAETIKVDSEIVEITIANASTEKKVAPIIDEIKNQIPEINLSHKVIPNTSEKKTESMKDDGRILNKYALGGFIMGIASIASVIVSIFSHIAPLTQNADLLLIIGGVMVMFMITSGISLKGLDQINDFPEKYKSKWLANVGYNIGRWGIIIALILLIGILLYMLPQVLLFRA